MARMSLDIESAKRGNDRMENMAETKLLNFNVEKSCYIVIGNKKTRKAMKDKLDSNPLQFCGADMKQAEQFKYLGDQLSGLGLADSVAVTVSKRKGLVIRSIFEIRTVIEDCRSQVSGGLAAGLDIWEMAVLPMLLNNADCWQEVSNKTMEELDKLHIMFLRCLFAVGSGCPTPSLFWETGSIRMKFMILQKKLLFLHHVATLPGSALAKQIYTVQTQLGLPGIAQECQDFLTKFQISQIDLFSKFQWKTFVKKHIRSMNKDDLLHEMKGYKKLNIEQLQNEEFKRKSYLSSLNIYESRMRFKIKSHMTPSIRMNFQSDVQHTRDMWACPGCLTGGDIGCRDTQYHVMICPSYADLRQDKDLTKDKDVVHYFQQFIKVRQNLN